MKTPLSLINKPAGLVSLFAASEKSFTMYFVAIGLCFKIT
jgi:hypothetical protein